jgi:hypothetical protein
MAIYGNICRLKHVRPHNFLPVPPSQMKLHQTLITVALGALSVGGAVIAAEQSGQFPAWSDLLKGIGAYVIATAGVILTIGVLIHFRTNAPPLDQVTTALLGKIRYEVEQATIDDLDYLYTKYEDLFGSDLVPKDEFARWMARNPRICFKVLRITKRGAEYKATTVGFFDFEPLTANALKRLRRTKPNEIPGPLSENDIRPDKNPAKGYYIGSIGATSRWKRDQAATLLWTFDFASKLNIKTDVTLFANPFTDDGLRLCRTFGFVPLNKDRNRGLWSLDLPAGARILNYDEKVRRILLREA